MQTVVRFYWNEGRFMSVTTKITKWIHKGSVSSANVKRRQLELLFHKIAVLRTEQLSVYKECKKQIKKLDMNCDVTRSETEKGIEGFKLFFQNKLNLNIFFYSFICFLQNFQGNFWVMYTLLKFTISIGLYKSRFFLSTKK